MNPHCQLCGAEMVWREGTSKSTGKPYAFWGCPTKNPDGTYCKGSVNPKMGHTQPYKPPYRPQTAPQSVPLPRTVGELVKPESDALKLILEGIKEINDKLDWIQRNVVDKDLTIPVVND